jgi:hypothetical protein
MATSKATTRPAATSGFKPEPTDAPVTQSFGQGRSYSEEQLAFFKDCAALVRTTVDAEGSVVPQWYKFDVPNTRTFVSLLRTAANYMTDKMDTPTGVKVKIVTEGAAQAVKDEDERAKADENYTIQAVPATVKFCFGERGKPRGKGAKKSA